MKKKKTEFTKVIGAYTFQRADILGPQLRLIPFHGNEQLWKAHYGEVSDGTNILSLTIELLFIAHFWQFRVLDEGAKTKEAEILVWKGNRKGEVHYKEPDQALKAAIGWIEENYHSNKMER